MWMRKKSKINAIFAVGCLVLLLMGCTEVETQERQQMELANETREKDQNAMEGGSLYSEAFYIAPEQPGLTEKQPDLDRDATANETASDDASIETEQSSAVETEPKWMPSPCPKVTFQEDPAACYGYIMWQYMDKMAHYFTDPKIAQRCAQEPGVIISGCMLADLNFDGIPEFMFCERTPGPYACVMIYDVSGKEIQDISFGLHVFDPASATWDLVLQEDGTCMYHVCVNAGRGMDVTKNDAYIAGSSDGIWNIWDCRFAGMVDSDWTDTRVYHNGEEQEDPDQVIYDQWVSQPTVPAPDGYFCWYSMRELQELTGYDTTGEDWWVSYAKMLWQVYTESPAFATTQQNWAEHHPGETPPWEQSDAA